LTTILSLTVPIQPMGHIAFIFRFFRLTPGFSEGFSN